MVAQRTDEAMVSVDAYLTLEETSQIKHEYAYGRVLTMSGGTIDHDTIANEIRTMLNNHLENGLCRGLGPDVRVRVAAAVYYYPDALLTCESLDGRAVQVVAPRLIVEVLSESTATDDRGVKFAEYQTIAGLEEYLLVDSRQRVVERYHRTTPDLWTYQRFGPDAGITLESIGLSFPVAAVYRRTQL